AAPRCRSSASSRLRRCCPLQCDLSGYDLREVSIPKSRSERAGISDTVLKQNSKRAMHHARQPLPNKIGRKIVGPLYWKEAEISDTAMMEILANRNRSTQESIATL